jgi:NPCBM/NEW2 domain-containing protein
VLLVLFRFALVALQGVTVEARPLRGESFRGELRALGSDSVTIDAGAAGGAKTFATSSLVALRFLQPGFLQNDGSAKSLARAELAGGDSIELLVAGARVKIPVNALARLVFPDRVSAGAIELSAPAEGDRLYRLRPAAQGEAVVEPVNGTLVSFLANGVEFESVLGRDPFPYDQLVALAITPLAERAPASAPAPAPSTIFLAPDGRLGARIAGLERGELRLESRALGALALPPAAIRAIRFRSDRFVEVSGLDPVQVEETPYFGGEPLVKFPWQRDRSVTGRPLRVGGVPFESGLGVHSKSRLTYAVDGRFAGFRAAVGLDDETLELPRRGSVVFRVHEDGRLLWESPIVRSGERALPVPELDLRGVRRLTLEVDYADGFDIADRADWCEPLLIVDPPPASAPAAR